MLKLSHKLYNPIGRALLVILITASNAFAQSTSNSSISVDDTLGSEHSVLGTGSGQNTTLITGGAQRGTNLFHSFYHFNVGQGASVLFLPVSDIRNIIARVTGPNFSNIDGTLGVQGNANLFLINPNGIIFGKGGRLNLNGSFFASTADSLVFDNGFEFSTSHPQAPPALLNVNIPIGLRFGRNPGSIINNAERLEIKPGSTIGFIGGNVHLQSGSIFAQGSNVEIGSVTEGSFVSLSQPSSTSWSIGYNGATGSQDIYLSGFVITTADISTSGDINFWGRNIALVNGSDVNTLNLGGSSGGDIKIYADESLTLDSSSITTGVLDFLSFATGEAGDIDITTKRLIVTNGSLIDTSSDASNQVGASGNLNINATESIEVSNTSRLTAQSFAEGNAGNIILKTSKLVLKNGGTVTASSSSSGNGGNLTVDAFSVDITGGGQLGESGLFAESINPNGGNAGNLTIKTNQLNVFQGGTISVSSIGAGTAGNLQIDANTIFLDDGGLLKATTQGGEGNIFITAEKLILRNNSLISTEATNSANGGNIFLDTAILLALPPTGFNGSDIQSNAFRGNGGNITINAQGVFGLEARKATMGNQTNDIDASSQFGRSGQVQINTITDPSQGLVELPTTVVDPNTLVAQNACRRGTESEFTNSGRGGLPTNPNQDLSNTSAQVDLVEPTASQTSVQAKEQSTTASASPQQATKQSIAPAQGWVYNEKGEIVLVAYNPSVTSPQRLKDNTACAGQ
jgi:filamentous hemagglutinin family protein